MSVAVLVVTFGGQCIDAQDSIDNSDNWECFLALYHPRSSCNYLQKETILAGGTQRN